MNLFECRTEETNSAARLSEVPGNQPHVDPTIFQGNTIFTSYYTRIDC